MRKTILILVLMLSLGSGRVARAASVTDDCSLLTPAQVQQVLGQPFNAPTKTPDIPPFGNKWGTHCTYRSQRGGNARVDFFVHVTASAAQAKQWYDLGATAGQPKAKLEIGDAAYIDHSEVHVRKGKVLYWIVVSGVAEEKKKATDLATSVAARI